MKRNLFKASLTGRIFTIAFPVMTMCLVSASDADAQKFRHITSSTVRKPKAELTAKPVCKDTIPEISVDSLINSIALPARPYNPVNLALGPRVFSGYRHLADKHFGDITLRPDYRLVADTLFSEVPDSLVMPLALGMITRQQALARPETTSPSYETPAESGLPEIAPGISDNDNPVDLPDLLPDITTPTIAQTRVDAIDITSDNVIPLWLRNALVANRIQQDMLYRRMIEHPEWIQYSDWTLPKPPRLPEDDINFSSYMRKLDLPDVDINKAILPEENINKRHWLHIFQGALQFSQAYVSKTWYQGGNNHLSLLFNLLWDVNLNRVWHPNLMFQNTISYKLGLNSMPSGSLHAYSISEDIFQWNMQFGFKAFTNWFYSITTQFKTQMLCNYEEKSWTRTASFLSPGSLNVGVGMTYNRENQKKTFKISASISPLSYNMATVIDRKVDPVPYKVEPPHKTHSEIGSNAEINLTWKLHNNISYRGRFFLFSDYTSFLGDWENTFDFTINKFLSTQLYVHLRFDSESAINDSKWRHFMMKEILSFGLSYRFSTK